jgi:DNA-binding SARP family transcriptional activator/Tfp pilus assembly protein PilF
VLVTFRAENWHLWGEQVEFCLIGPLVVRSGQAVLPIPQGKQRAVLAVLLVRAGQVVPAFELAQLIWDGAPPRSARVTLQNYVKRLRQALGESGQTRIRTRDAGYLIEARPGELDLLRFATLCDMGRAATGKGDWDRAAVQLRAALALWRGQPFVDVSCQLLAASETPRLAEMRIAALEERIAADLHLGRHAQVIPELQQLALAERLRERVHALLMRALYQTGRQADALAAYQTARQALISELGMEPGPELRELHQQILAADPGLSLPAARPGGQAATGRARGRWPTPPALSPLPTLPTPPGPVSEAAGQSEPGWPGDGPSQLPASARLIGRRAETRALNALLADSATADSSVVISAISGTAGVGKTTLALHWARQVAERFGDGLLHVDLRGFDPSGQPVPPDQALRGFLDAFDVPPERIPADLDTRAALYRSVLAGRRVLVVLDNALDSDQVRPLLPGSPGCLVVVTSRTELTSLAAAEGAHLINLDTLTEAESSELLEARLGQRRVTGEPEAVRGLIDLCGGLPLALAVTAARAAYDPRLPLGGLVRELTDARRRLDALNAGEETSVRAVFSWSYRQLSPAAARMFRLLGLHRGPDISAPAAASLAGTPLPRARGALHELIRAHLVTEHVSDRFLLHDLLRAYATEAVADAESTAEQLAAVGRVLDHYLHTACAADRLLNRGRDRITPQSPAAGVTPEQLADYDQAMSWFAAEHKVLLSALDLAAEHDLDAQAWQIPWAMVDFHELTGRWPDWLSSQRTALAAVQRLGDRAGEARCRGALGKICGRTGLAREAQIHLSRALGLFRQVHDPVGEARTHQDLSVIFDDQGRPTLALRHDEHALRLYRQAGHRAGQANALNAIGWLHAVLGDYQQAIDSCELALALYRELGHERGLAASWDSLGYARHHLGQHAEAVTYFEQSLAAFRDQADRPREAEVLTHLGDARHATGNLPAARDAWEQALAILDDLLRHPEADSIREKLKDLP